MTSRAGLHRALPPSLSPSVPPSQSLTLTPLSPLTGVRVAEDPGSRPALGKQRSRDYPIDMSATPTLPHANLRYQRSSQARLTQMHKRAPFVRAALIELPGHSGPGPSVTGRSPGIAQKGRGGVTWMITLPVTVPALCSAKAGAATTGRLDDGERAFHQVVQVQLDCGQRATVRRAKLSSSQ